MKNFLATFIAFSLSFALFASESLETKTYREILKKVDEKITTYGLDQVLLVLDIDNTVLASKQNLGSDQWFTWQENGLKEESCNFCVASTFDELLAIQEKLFAVSSMIPVEDFLPAKIKELQAKGLKIILLTSRGPEIRNLTERELKKNGFDFSKTKIGKDVAGLYIPYKLENSASYGLSSDVVSRLGLSEARPVSYANGIYMTSGQNKGAMLKTILHKFDQDFKSVVFVDDHVRHTIRMQLAFEKSDVDMVTYLYGGVSDMVNDFNQGDKAQVIAEWEILKSVLDVIFK